MPVQNPLLRLHDYGQSVWLDSLSRRLIESHKLRNLIETDGVSGVTSNPAIFQKAIGGSQDYDSDIERLAGQGKIPVEIYQELAIKDIRDAADLLAPIHGKTKGTDGYVSLEVSPLLAHDMEGTIREAKQLWTRVARPNVMIKIPATDEGLPAIARCTAEGININVTLIFGVKRYREVADAYLTGLEQRGREGQDLRKVRSVASFFVSRIDVLVDRLLDELAQVGRAHEANKLRGRAAIANAKIAYQMYREMIGSTRFQSLERQGARRQWLLWGSTSTKNKEYSDVKYVEDLIGAKTINTMPIETLEAYRDHGTPAARLDRDVDREREVVSNFTALGIEMAEVAHRLEEEGIEKFVEPFEKLMLELAEKTHSPVGGGR